MNPKIRDANLGPRAYKPPIPRSLRERPLTKGAKQQSNSIGKHRSSTSTTLDSLIVRMQPLRIAVGIPLMLPNRYAGFYFIDDPATGGERGVAMRGADADPHR